jgi:hypothetical protein
MHTIYRLPLTTLAAACLAIAGFAATTAHAAPIASDGFENGGFNGGTGAWTSDWSNSGFSNVDTQAVEGSRSAESRTFTSGGTINDSLTRSLNVAGLDDLEVSFRWAQRFTEAGDESIIVNFDYGTGAFTQIGNITVPGQGSGVSWKSFSEELDETQLSGTSQRLQIIASIDSTSSDFIYIDDVRVTGIPEPASLALLAAGGLCLLKRQPKSASGGIGRRRRSV